MGLGAKLDGMGAKERAEYENGQMEDFASTQDPNSTLFRQKDSARQETKDALKRNKRALLAALAHKSGDAKEFMRLRALASTVGYMCSNSPSSTFTNFCLSLSTLGSYSSGATSTGRKDK
jgi:hypothetical protein